MESLLYVLNVSNADRLSADSGWIFANVLLPELVERGTRVAVSGPVPMDDYRVRSLPMTVPATKYRARFGTDIDEAARLVRVTQADVVFVNTMETAPAVRAAMMEVGSNAILGGYCHYVPFHLDTAGRIVVDPAMNDGGLAMPVVLAFFAGLLACDRVLVHSVTARGWISGAAEQLGVDLGDRLRTVAPARDPRLVRQSPPQPTAWPPVAVYNHRLYAHYGTAGAVALARRLTAEQIGVRVLDLFGTRHTGRARLDSSPERFRRELASISGVEVRSDGGDRAVYAELLADARFAIAPARPACIWSMSVIDCQAMGVPVIAPNMAWFPEAVHPELLFDDLEQAVELSHRLIDDEGFRSRHTAIAVVGTEHLAPARAAARFAEALA